ncbi:MAG: glycosyltransferase family 39 protein [Candidatus Hydrogenedentes bacterium]|nr:glycosyltransferase family 39 protein [Candidatus Hydrogenedentota bacterium]
MALAKPLRDRIAAALEDAARVLVLGIEPDALALGPAVVDGAAELQSVRAKAEALEAGSWDAVVVVDVLHQLADGSEVAAFLARVSAALSVGGRLIVIEPNARYLGRRFWDSLASATPLTHRSVAQAALEVGLEPRELVPKFVPVENTGWLTGLCVGSDWAQAFFGRRLWLSAIRPAGPPAVRATAVIRQAELPLRHLLFLGLILVAGLIARLYHVTEPPSDAHAWRQTQTLMVAKGFFEHEFNLFHPRVLWRTIDEVHPEGYVGGTELMVTPFLTAALYWVFGTAYWVDRVIPIFFSLLAVAYFHRLAARFCGYTAATVAAALLCFSPFYLFLGRVHMPESFAFCMTFMTLYYFDRWISSDERAWFWPAAVSCVLMLLGKPQSVYVALPMLYLVATRHGLRAILRPRLYVFLVAVAVPCALYVWWSFHVLTAETHIVYQPPGLSALGFKFIHQPAFYRRMLTVAWGRAVGPALFVLGALGALLPARTRRTWFPHVFLAASIASIFLTPGLHWANDYYQTFLAPPAALLAGRLLAPLFSRRIGKWAALGLTAFTIVTSIHAARGFYHNERTESMYRCGVWIREHSRPADRVLVSFQDPTALYFADRIGWVCRLQADGQPIVFGRELITRLQGLGATVVAVSDGCWLDNYAANRRYGAMRDFLYDTYYSHRGDDYAVFFPALPADLDLPRDGHVDFGTWETLKYLRGDWGPIYRAGVLGRYVHKGAEAGSIAFNAPAGVGRVTLKISAEAHNRHVAVLVDGAPIGEVILERAWQQVPVPIELDGAASAPGRHTITLDVTDQDGGSRRLLLWELDAVF